MITLCGSFDGHPVSVTVNPSLPQSLLSSQFALVANIPRTVSFGTGVIELSAQGPLRLPTPSGWYESRQRFLVAYVREHDVVLGSDWLRATQASVQTSTQASYLNDPHVPSGTMADGHAWVPSPSVVSDRFPLPRYTDDAAVASASTPDDGCKASSSHGLGSNMRVARADVPYNMRRRNLYRVYPLRMGSTPITRWKFRSGLQVDVCKSPGHFRVLLSYVIVYAAHLQLAHYGPLADDALRSRSSAVEAIVLGGRETHVSLIIVCFVTETMSDYRSMTAGRYVGWLFAMHSRMTPTIQLVVYDEF
ncbi:hypothetical protein C2E23DRAFT_895007 [Lenzites betulinus]|nr:hypothetical protein C2E23DRAFT_895007 [Lenzites betulinus]